MADRILMFKERPYAATLYTEFLMTRCSRCFFPAEMPCDKCQQVVYCDDQCAIADRPLHEVECPCPPASVWPKIRLAARFAIRQCIDKGEVVLSSGFPAKVKHRTCKDLMTHYRDFKNDKRHKDRMEELWTMWQERITDARLSTLKKADVLRLYSTLGINCFGIGDYASATNDETGSSSGVIGVGLYIDSSRFNHSCYADMYVTFSGNVMSVMRYRTAKERHRMKERDFNRLTINYGVPPYHAHNAYLPLTKQRIKSLQSRYYFKCRCEKCTDKEARMLEESAATVECSKCKKPYVWTGRTMKLRQMCSCSVKKIKVDAADLLSVKQLDSSWEEVMIEADDKSDPRDIIDCCEPLWSTARKYWHRTNLRLGQLSERMFCAYCQKASDLLPETMKEERAQDLRLALIAGQDMVACYETYKINAPYLAGCYYQVARICWDLKQKQEAYEWSTKAINVYRKRNNSAKELMVLEWRSKMQSECDESATETEQKNMNRVIEVSAS